MVTLGIILCCKIVISGDLKGSAGPFLFKWKKSFSFAELIFVRNIFDLPKYNMLAMVGNCFFRTTVSLNALEQIGFQ